MKLNKTTTLLAILGLAAAIQTAQASLTSDTLADLSANGGSLTIGDKTFSGFSYQESGLTTFNAANITVTASIVNGIYALSWTGNIALSSGVASSADLLLNYVVTANAGLITMIGQSYTGSAQNGSLSVDETVHVGGFGGATVATSHVDVNSPNGTSTGPNLSVLPPQSTLYVTKDIAFGTFGAGLVTMSVVTQQFTQTSVPEPSTVVAGALLLLPFGVSTLRILRKSKVS
jgi:hypothetical protein